MKNIPKRDEIIGNWRRLHNEELRVLYSSPNIIRAMKPRRMRWEGGHKARTGIREELHRDFWCENVEKRQHVESLYVGRRAILKWAFKK